MLYDIFINGKCIATVGPTDANLEHLHVSVSLGGSGSPMVFATGVSKAEAGERRHTIWVQADISASDSIMVKPSDLSQPSPPVRARVLRSEGEASTRVERFCDFCKLGESEVGQIIQAGDSPHICIHCAELCVEIFRGKGA